MSYTIEDLEQIARKIRFDLTALQAKTTELLNGIGEIATKLPPEPEDDSKRCPRCGLTVKGKPVSEHLEDVHGIRQDVGVDEGGNR